MEIYSIEEGDLIGSVLAVKRLKNIVKVHLNIQYVFLSF